MEDGVRTHPYPKRTSPQIPISHPTVTELATGGRWLAPEAEDSKKEELALVGGRVMPETPEAEGVGETGPIKRAGWVSYCSPAQPQSQYSASSAVCTQ